MSWSGMGRGARTWSSCSEGPHAGLALCGQSRQKDGPDVPPGLPSLPIRRQMFYDSRVWGKQSCFPYSYCKLHLTFLQNTPFFYLKIPERLSVPKHVSGTLRLALRTSRAVLWFFSPPTNRVHILRSNTWLPLTLMMFGVWCEPTFYPLNDFFFPK